MGMVTNSEVITTFVECVGDMCYKQPSGLVRYETMPTAVGKDLEQSSKHERGVFWASRYGFTEYWQHKKHDQVTPGICPGCLRREAEGRRRTADYGIYPVAGDRLPVAETNNPLPPATSYLPPAILNGGHYG